MSFFRPNSLDALLEFLKERKGKHLFRGQSPETRILNSTLARELRIESAWLPRNYIPPEPLPTWPIKGLYVYHRKILSSLVPHEDVLRPLAGKGDPVLVVIRYIQQNPSQPKIINAIPNHPTPAIEFSESSDIALYFSVDKTDVDGAIFCIPKKSIPTARSFAEAFQIMAQKEDVTPCIIDPLTDLNDIDDPKAKRQQAVYIFQRDLRDPIDKYLPREKVIVSRSLNIAVQEYLKKQGITKEFVYGISPALSNAESETAADPVTLSK